MSEDQEEERFRSRSKQRKQRQQIRNKILQSLQQNKIKSSYHNQAKPITQEKKKFKIQQYKGIAQQAKLFKKQEESEGEDLDMFGEDIQITQNKKEKNITNLMTDEQGYYIVTQEKTINNGKYKILSKIGKGMFGTVVKACKNNQINENVEQKKQLPELYAIKIARNIPITLQSGQRQYKILSQIKKSQYIMKIYDYFFQGEHLCIVCEMMGQDLRSYVRKHQSQITLQKIKQFSISIFMSLHELRKNKIIHADIKPDNFLLTTDQKFVKLSDFGTSYHVDQHTSQTDELVARYYRAPQIILGYEMTTENRHGIDTWAAACSLFQLYTGQFLFNGSSNNEMLKLMMETKGKFNVKMLKNSNFCEKHFDNEHNFIHEYYDKSSKSDLRKKMQISITQDRQLLNMLKKFSRQKQDPKILHNFKDFLQRCLCLNPKDRLSPSQAFLHPFLNHQVKLD